MTYNTTILYRETEVLDLDYDYDNILDLDYDDQTLRILDLGYDPSEEV